MIRLPRLLAAVTAVGCATLAAASGTAAAHSPSEQQAAYGQFLEFFVETPTAENPLGTGDKCADYGGYLTPVPVPEDPSITCKVSRDTRLLVNVWGSFCTSATDPPNRTPRELRACALNSNSGIVQTWATLDGRPIRVSETFTPFLVVDVPESNILGVPAQRTGASGHGWTALVGRLSPGVHRLVQHVEGTYAGSPLDWTLEAKIIVRGH